MHRSTEAAAVALLVAGIALTGCATKHRAANRRTTPAPIHYGETGLASWYGIPYHGRAAANGEIYDMEKLTAAHRTLPFGTWVRVTNLQSEKSVDLRITDRGPFVGGRIIDLSHAAAQAIDLIGPGVAMVRLDIISAPRISIAENWYAVQAGAFRDKERAEQLRSSLEVTFGIARLVLRAGNPPLWRVLVGRERTEDAAAEIAARLSRDVGPAFVIRLDDATPPTANGAVGSTQQ
jgi:rare lipoprotein A